MALSRASRMLSMGQMKITGSEVLHKVVRKVKNYYADKAQKRKDYIRQRDTDIVRSMGKNPEDFGIK